MPIRLVAMDLDDTLLRDDWTISPRVVESLRRAQALGVITTIATGRMPKGMRRYAEQLGIDVPVITYHGAMIQKVLSGEILFRRVIPHKTASDIVKYVLDSGFHCHIYLQDRVFTQEKNEYSRDYSRLNGLEIEQGDLLSLLARGPEGVEKILLIGEESELDHLAPSLKTRYSEQVHVTKSKSSFLEMVEVSVNKGTALKALANQLGIQQEEIMAIGDSFNDLEMIRYAGVGVAMGNARAEVKEAADYVTGTNMEDGVAQAVEKFVLLK